MLTVTDAANEAVVSINNEDDFNRAIFFLAEANHEAANTYTETYAGFAFNASFYAVKAIVARANGDRKIHNKLILAAGEYFSFLNKQKQFVWHFSSL